MERRKFVIGLGALATGSAAAVGTGAFTAAELSDRDVAVTVSDDSAGLVSLTASEDYPDYVDETDGELGIDFDYEGYGVNPNSTYQLGQVPDDLGNLSAIDHDPLSEGDITDDYAFKIGNNSPSTQNVEVDIDMDQLPDDVTLYLIARATAVDESDATAPGDEGLAVGAVTTTDRQSVLSFTADSSGNIPSGNVIHVTLLIARDSKGSVDDGVWEGSMTVRAGEHDDIQDF